MRILDFPARPRPVPPVLRSIASIEMLLEECRGRQTVLRSDGRRLRASLDRLSLLALQVVRGTERVRQTIGRLRSCQAGPGIPGPRA